jgi:nitrile hydratase
VSRINDVGGMAGFPAVVEEPDEPPFHADWEAHVFALNGALIKRGVYNLDEFRDAIERMPPQEYLAASYYERWFAAITTLLAEKGVATVAELEAGDEHAH